MGISTIFSNYTPRIRDNSSEIFYPEKCFLLTYPLHVYIHECGHVLAAQILYQNAKPKIQIHGFGFQEAMTIANTRELSKIGKIFGSAFSKAVCYSSGNLAVLITLIGIRALTQSPLISSICYYHCVRVVVEEGFLGLNFATDSDLRRLCNEAGTMTYAALVGSFVILGLLFDQIANSHF